MANKVTKKTAEEYLKFLLNRPIGSLYTDKKNTHSPSPSKGDLLAALREQYHSCQKCPLAKEGRKNVIFGVGNPDATLMFVGEGPGRDEDLQGVPFVGRAGKLLTKIINAMNLCRADVFISNTVKCRPLNNRTPMPHESETCINLILLNEIAIVQPKIICALGATAARALLGTELRISQIRGTFIPFENTLIIPTYHPAYLLRNPNAKKLVWNDMQKIMAKIEALSRQNTTD